MDSALPCTETRTHAYPRRFLVRIVIVLVRTNVHILHFSAAATTPHSARKSRNRGAIVAGTSILIDIPAFYSLLPP